MEKSEGISLLQLFKVMFGKFWRLLIIMVCVAAAGTLALEFGYNKIKVNYESEFKYGSVALNKNEYVDGSSFQYLSIISRDNLMSIKDSNEDFASIDVEGMIKNNKIKLERTLESTSVDAEGVTINDYSYKLTVSKKYFSNNDQARDFVEAVASTPVKINSDITKNTAYNAYLVQYTLSDDLSSKAKNLQNELKFIQDQYEKLDELYGDVSFAIDGQMFSLSSELQSITTYYAGTSIDSINFEVDINGFVNDAEKNDLESSKIALTGEKAYNDKIIGAINSEIGAIAAENPGLSDIQLEEMMETITELTLRNGEIDYQLSVIDKKLSNIGSTDPSYLASLEAFKVKMDNFYNSLTSFANRLSSASTQITNKYTTIGFGSTNVVEQKGGFALYGSILISLAAGLVVGAIVNLIVDRKHLRDDIVETKEK